MKSAFTWRRGRAGTQAPFTLDSIWVWPVLFTLCFCMHWLKEKQHLLLSKSGLSPEVMFKCVTSCPEKLGPPEGAVLPPISFHLPAHGWALAGLTHGQCHKNPEQAPLRNTFPKSHGTLLEPALIFWLKQNKTERAISNGPVPWTWVY
jgi:hypothetical protein